MVVVVEGGMVCTGRWWSPHGYLSRREWPSVMEMANNPPCEMVDTEKEETSVHCGISDLYYYRRSTPLYSRPPPSQINPPSSKCMQGSQENAPPYNCGGMGGAKQGPTQ